MHFYSTNKKVSSASFKDAVLKGLPDDNGLYMPEVIPQFSDDFFKKLPDLSFQEIAFQSAKLVIEDEIDEVVLRSIVNEVFNFDESKIPDYTLPELLKAKNGSKITTSEKWMQAKRHEILTRFEAYMYGKVPQGKVDVDTRIVKELDALNGKATMKEVRMTFSANNKEI